MHYLKEKYRSAFKFLIGESPKFKMEEAHDTDFIDLLKNQLH